MCKFHDISVYAGGEDAWMIRMAREVNNYKTEWVIEKIKDMHWSLKWKTVKKPKCLYGAGI